MAYQHPSTPESAHYPSFGQQPQMRLLPEDAGRSARWRLMIGLSGGVLALFAGFYAYLNITGVTRVVTAIHDRGGNVAPASLALAATIIAAYCLAALAYAAVAVWNLAVRGGTARAPLVTAIVVAAIGLAASVAAVVASGIASHGAHLAGIGLNVLIVGRAIFVLRMKPVPYVPAGLETYAPEPRKHSFPLDS